jgi:hypothetical protein
VGNRSRAVEHEVELERRHQLGVEGTAGVVDLDLLESLAKGVEPLGELE